MARFLDSWPVEGVLYIRSPRLGYNGRSTGFDSPPDQNSFLFFLFFLAEHLSFGGGGDGRVSKGLLFHSRCPFFLSILYTFP